MSRMCSIRIVRKDLSLFYFVIYTIDLSWCCVYLFSRWNMFFGVWWKFFDVKHKKIVDRIREIWPEAWQCSEKNLCFILGNMTTHKSCRTFENFHVIYKFKFTLLWTRKRRNYTILIQNQKLLYTKSTISLQANSVSGRDRPLNCSRGAFFKVQIRP